MENLKEVCMHSEANGTVAGMDVDRRKRRATQRKELPFTKVEEIIRKAYLGEKDLELGVSNMLPLRWLSDPRGATYPVGIDYLRNPGEVWAQEVI